MPRKFQRARRPEEKEIRRQAILKAARKMLDEVETSELSLNELARRSGVSKPNVYRYFESREEILLQVWVEEVRALGERLHRVMPKIAIGDFDGVASAIVDAFVARPKLCELTSIVSPVLERHLSAEAILQAKSMLVASTEDVAALIHERLPALTFEECAWASAATATYVAGIWPAVRRPMPAALAERPELAALQPVFDRDLRRFLDVLFAGLRRPAPHPPRKA